VPNAATHGAYLATVVTDFRLLAPPRETKSGPEFHYFLNFIAIIFFLLARAGIALFLAVKMFQREDVLFHS
jgi:hypothetical protein